MQRATPVIGFSDNGWVLHPEILMKSDTITIEQFFQNRRQYCVPFYQRAYVWTLENQWEQLCEDILAKADARLQNAPCTPHFLGAVVLEPQPRKGLIGVESYHIIDGQQRLTTLQYVLTATLLALNGSGNQAFTQIVTGCITNGNPETMRDATVERFKVWPTFRDRATFRAALTSTDLSELALRFQAHFTQGGVLRKIGMEHPAALAALWFFTHEFEEWLAAGNEHQAASRAEALVVAILQDLKVVSITLDPEDDAQIIFETLNGRGAQLHATDLIRNYIFMRADHEHPEPMALYDTLWSAFETEYWSEEQRRGRLKKPRLEWLIHSTLQAELHEDVDLARIYHEYRRFATDASHPRTAEQQLVTLQNYAAQYKELVSGVGNSPIARFGHRIAAYDVTTLYPLALMISTSSATDAEKAEMYDDIASYLVRRAICDLTSKSYNNVFQQLLKQLYAEGINPAKLRTLMQANSGDISRWPSDAEFRNACLSAPLYPGRLDTAKTRTVLTELEREIRATVRLEDAFAGGLELLDVDHILPQNWYAFWPLGDGSAVSSEEGAEVELIVRSGLPLSERQGLIAARQAAVKTLGNLTLLNLGVNRQAQHHAFAQKRELLIANTNLRLNIPLIPLLAWDETSIAARSEQMMQSALKLWPGPRP
jgi:hypothetical protein